MGTLSIREKLHDYISYADEDKLKAIYILIEDEINEHLNLWEDKDFLKQIDLRLTEYESGNLTTPTWEEVKQRAKGNKANEL